MEAIQVAQYESDASDEEIVGENYDTNGNERSSKKRKPKCWVNENTFDNAGEAEASIGNERSKHYTNYTENGKVVYYRCDKAKRRGSQCEARIYLLYHADSDKVTVYKTEVEHGNHHDKLRGVDRNKYGTYIISLGESEEWCKNNLNIPTDPNKPFVVSYKILYNDEVYEDDQDIEDDGENKFRIFISFICLLNIASTSSHIHANATHKLVWQGYPVLIVETTDLNKSFHPFGLATCSNGKTEDFEIIFNSIQIGMQVINKDLLKPTASISDAADAIKNGFRNVFNNEYNQIMCWAHMKRKVGHRICQINDKDIRKETMEDIEMLQLSNSVPVFILASTLFIKKWNMNNKQQNRSILDFLEYFDNEWFQSNDDDGTFRERHVLSRFLTITTNIINNWSVERDASSINAKIFATEPTISLQLWTSSYQWAKSIKDIICIENSDSKQYYIPARDLQSITQADLYKYKNRKLSNFNQFKKSFDICLPFQMSDNNKKSQLTSLYKTRRPKSYEIERTKENLSQKAAKSLRYDLKSFNKTNTIPKERFSQNTVALHFKVSLSELLDRMKDAEPSFVRYVGQ
ncbi:unnamed protein product [Rotaria sordida]|uniref:MULE transposase domain-containing protein n=1 Tax=Rotaria sordida TaxID=392033 RepID=A0A814IEG3_9BILA|nr:unnamed protein product [Rotaria sordida]